MKTYVFDVDGTLCSLTDGDYQAAEPFKDRIEQVNKLYDEGNTIVISTARGMGRTNGSTRLSYELFYDFTLKQLTDWGVKHHLLFLGKPAGDIYIDDKGIRADNFFTNQTCP
tara:strand:+ start:237 stop:572 length:336 start_codon:yes stop_codon:yes gene_type:complete